MRTFRPQAVILIVVAVVLVGLIATLTRALRMESTSSFVQQGHPAHDFTLPVIPTSTSKGETMSLSALRGKMVVINFWASWCESCREEGVALEQFYRTKGEHVQLIGVAIQDTAAAAATFAAGSGMSFPLLLDDKGSVAIDYGVTGVPETFILDGNGVIRDRIVGPVTLEELTRATSLKPIVQP